MPPEERELVRGLVVNKFRGDPTLFADGVGILEERGGVPVLGVVPYLPALAIPEEDSVALDTAGPAPTRTLDVAVLRLPHIANFDDFDPLRAEAGVGLRYVASPAALGRPHAVILPGSKSTLADLAWLRTQGFAEPPGRLAAEGTAIVGICGGYQMLGRVVRDPCRVESPDGEAPGLGLLPVETTFETAKATFQARARVLGGPGWLGGIAGQEVEGYEIHAGRTVGGSPWLEITCRNGAATALPDGAASDNGRVWGCYLHGLFANSAFLRGWLASLSASWKAGRPVGVAPLHQALDRLADAVESALDMSRLEAILRLSEGEV
jgi:adenosylcobyric acid synthase